MSLPVIFHEFAERELIDVATYYAQARPGLGGVFLDEVEHASSLLSENPQAGQIVLGEVRKWPLQRFPYAVIYRPRDSDIRILAIASFKRRPFYWRSRQ